MDVLALGKLKLEEANRIEQLVREIEDKQRELFILLNGSNIDLPKEEVQEVKDKVKQNKSKFNP
jgi:hypothetical protein